MRILVVCFLQRLFFVLFLALVKISAVFGQSNISCTSGVPEVIFSESWENGVDQWTGDFNKSTASWYLTSGSTSSFQTGPSGAHDSTNYIHFNSYYTGIASITSPPIDLSLVNNQVELSFWIHGRGVGIAGSQLSIAVGLSPNGPFTTVYDTLFAAELQSSANDPWINQTIDISAYNNQMIYLRIQDSVENLYATQANLAIDLLKITACVDCVRPTDFTITDIGDSLVSLNWTENLSATQWQLNWGDVGFIPGSGCDTLVNVKPVVMNQLPGEKYDYYVRSICAPGDTSYRSGPVTHQKKYLNAYFESFENSGSWPATLERSSKKARILTNLNKPGSLYAMEILGGFDGEYVITPEIDTKNDTNIVSFDWKIKDFDNGFPSQIDVQYWDSTAWVSLSNWPKSSSYNDWQNYRDTIVASNDDFKLRFLVISASFPFTSNNWVFDNIKIEGRRLCVSPTNLHAFNMDGTSVDLDWTENGNATNWKIEWKPTGFLPGSGDVTVVNSKPYSLAGLTPGVVYDYYVSSICPAGDTSISSLPYTIMSAHNTPYLQYFDCWPWHMIKSDSTHAYTSNGAMMIMGEPGASVKTPVIHTTSDSAIVYFKWRNGIINAPEQSDQATVQYWDGVSWNHMNGWPKSGNHDQWSLYNAIIVDTVPDFRIRFKIIQGSGVTYDDWNFDDLEIYDLDTCLRPREHKATFEGPDSVTLEWMGNPAMLAYQISYGNPGFIAGSGWDTIVQTMNVTLSGLKSEQYYDSYVRAICATGDTSDWSEVETFSTLSVPSYHEDMEHNGSWPLSLLKKQTDVWISSDCNSSGGYNVFVDGVAGSGFYTPAVNTQSDTNIVSFLWRNGCHESPNPDDFFKVQYWNGFTWVNAPGWPRYGLYDNWRQYKDTIVLAGKQPLKLRFSVGDGTGSGYDDWQFDDIRIYGPQSAGYPDSLSVVISSSKSAELEWQYAGNVAQWNVQWKKGVDSSDFLYDTLLTTNLLNLYGLDTSALYSWRVRGINSAGDTSLWSSISDFYTAKLLPYHSSWEDGFKRWHHVDYDDHNWSISSGGGVSKPSGAQHGTYYMHCNTNQAANGDYYVLESPYVDLSDVQLPSVIFDHYLFCQGGQDGSLAFEVSNDHGQNWIPVWSKGGCQGDAWLKDTVFMPFLTGDSAVIFRFAFNVGYDLSPYDYKAAVDHFWLLDMNCPPPIKPSVTYIHPTFADVYWTSGGATNHNLEYGISGFAPGTGTKIMDVSLPYHLSGLNPGTSYDIYVQDSCGSANVSHWIGPVSFFTENDVNCVSKKRFLLFEETWENGIDHWSGEIASGALNSWMLQSGKSSPPVTGPASAHQGSFYFECSTEAHGSTAAFSPAINLQQADQNVAGSFWYHAYGPGIAGSELHISAAVDTAGPFIPVWDTIFAHQVQSSETDSFVYQTFDLSQFAGQTIYLRFEYTNNQYQYADFAIDLLKVYACVDAFVDIAILDFDSIYSACGLNMESLQVKLGNMGTDTIPIGTAINYLVNDLVLVEDSLPNDLLPEKSMDYTFTKPLDLYTSLYDSTFKVKIFADATGDTVNSNDTAFFEVLSSFIPEIAVNDITILEGDSAILPAQHDYFANVRWYESKDAAAYFYEGDTLVTDALLSDTTLWFDAIDRKVSDPVFITDLMFYHNPLIIYLEISNVSDSPYDVSGWKVVFNKESYVDSVASQTWNLNTTIGPKQVKMNNYMDTLGMWTPGWQMDGNLWIALVDQTGEVVDFMSRGFSQNELNNMDVSIGKYNNWNPIDHGHWAGMSVETDSARTLRILYDSNTETDWATSNFTSATGYNQNMQKHPDFSLQACKSLRDSVNIFVNPKTNQDVGVVNVFSPHYFNDTSSQQLSIGLVNYGVDTAFVFDISYSVGLQSNTFLFNDTLPPGDSAIVNFPLVSIPYGTSELCVYTDLIGDVNTFNDGLCKDIYRQYTAPLPYKDGFENKDYFMKDTSQLLSTQWELASPSGNINAPYSGAKCWITDVDDVYMNNSYDILYTPYFSVDTLLVDSLVFWHYYLTQSEHDGGYVQYRNDTGGWSLLGTLNDSSANNWYNGNITNGIAAFTGFSSGWIRSAICVDTTHITNMASLAQFRFVFVSDSTGNYGDGWAIDDFWIKLKKTKKDVGIYSVVAPVDTTVVNQQVSVTVLFKNDGKDTLNTIPVVYEVPGITKAKNFESWTGVLLPDSIIEYSFNTQYPGPANDYQLVCYTSINNDINPYNDTLKTDLVAWHIPGDVGMEKVSVYGPYVWGTDSSMALEETFVRVEMVNYGSSAIDTLSLSYNVSDGQNGSDIWTGQLQAGDTLKYLFAKPFYSPGGSYGICAQAYAIEDTVNANDTICNNFTGVVGVESPYLPGVFVYQNVPNPATGKIKISYSIPRYGVIDFELFDKLGQLIKQRSYTKEKGTYDIMLNTDNLSPGVYIYCISFEGFKICRKMIVVH